MDQITDHYSPAIFWGDRAFLKIEGFVTPPGIDHWKYSFIRYWKLDWLADRYIRAKYKGLYTSLVSALLEYYLAHGFRFRASEARKCLGSRPR